MPTLYTLCGLPGSGKSTWALQHPECVVVSSDAIRAELFGDATVQDNPEQVFSILHQRVADALAAEKDVIFDATNIFSKRRKEITQRFKANHVCVFVNTPIAECLRRNAARDRRVPDKVIYKMARNFQPPTKEENFSKIIEITP